MESTEKRHEYEAGRILDKHGNVLSIVKAVNTYREVSEEKPQDLRPGNYA